MYPAADAKDNAQTRAQIIEGRSGPDGAISFFVLINDWLPLRKMQNNTGGM